MEGLSPRGALQKGQACKWPSANWLLETRGALQKETLLTSKLALEVFPPRGALQKGINPQETLHELTLRNGLKTIINGLLSAFLQVGNTKYHLTQK